MRRVALIAAACGCAALLAAAAPAAAATIDFETGAPCDFVDTSPLTTAFAGDGITFAGVDGAGGSILDQCGSFGIDAHSGVDFLAFNTDVGTGMTEQATFATPVSNIVLFISPGDGGDMLYELDAFDSAGVAQGGTGGHATSGEWTEVDLGATNISKLVLTGGNAAFLVDDLSFTGGGVPEPAVWALMLGGLFGAGALLRRRRAAIAAA